MSLSRWLLLRFDENNSGKLEIGELFTAIDDYFDGGITLDQFFGVIDLYFADPAE